MGGFSFWHILLVALLVMLLFGGKRFSAMMGDVAAGLKNFKAGMADLDDDRAHRRDDRPQLGLPERPFDAPPPIRTTDRREVPPHDPRA